MQLPTACGKPPAYSAEKDMHKQQSPFVLDLTWQASSNREAEVLFFDGVGYGDASLPIVSKALVSPNQITDAAMDGEWVGAIRHSDGSISVHIDFFGYYQLFYTTTQLNQANINAVSNDFSALVSYLRDRGCIPELDTSYAVPLLASTSSLFNQSYSPRTSCTQILRLAPQESIRVSSQAITIQKGQLFSNISDCRYEDLLEAGIDRCRKRLNLIESSGSSNKTLYLSGGKDSRACLALLLSAQNLNFTCSTRNPAAKSGLSEAVIERDFDIASSIVAYYGLNWHRPLRRRTVSRPFSEAVNEYRRFRSNKYYYFSPSSFLTVSAEAELAFEFRGGAGEALRGYWAEHFAGLPISARFKLTRGNVWHDASLIFQYLVGRDAIPGDLYQGAMQAFVKDFQNIPGTGIYDVLDNHYILHRNRYHFGNINQAYQTGSLIYYPLAQPEFLKAAQMLSHKSRSEGKVVFDIIRMSFPELHSFPYESGSFACAPEPKEFIQPKSALVQKKRAEFEAVQEIMLEESRALYSGPQQFSPAAALQKRLDESMDLLQDHSKDIANILNGGRRAKIKSLTNKNPKLVNNFVSKFEGMVQVFEPSTPYDAIALAS